MTPNTTPTASGGSHTRRKAVSIFPARRCDSDAEIELGRAKAKDVATAMCMVNPGAMSKAGNM